MIRPLAESTISRDFLDQRAVGFKDTPAMQALFSAGSKTFLVGEYSVLFGGSAVVLVTPPRFELRVKSGETNLVGVEKDSPAGLFYE